MMTLSAHKIYGPKGIGALYVREQSAKRKAHGASDTRFAMGDLRLAPIVTGGGQEFGIRSGTENVSLVVGFAKAVELVRSSQESEAVRIGKLRNYFWNALEKLYPNIELNGRATQRLPNILNLYLPDYQAEDFITALDLRGIAISAGSACAARSVAPSAVLRAFGYPRERIKKSVRVSFGRPTTRKEVDSALRIIKILLSRHISKNNIKKHHETAI